MLWLLVVLLTLLLFFLLLLLLLLFLLAWHHQLMLQRGLWLLLRHFGRTEGIGSAFLLFVGAAAVLDAMRLTCSATNTFSSEHIYN